MRRILPFLLVHSLTKSRKANIQVRIYKPTKNTMQSAKGKTKVWRIDWDVLQGSGRWENPLMGWASSADYMQGTTLAFRTREDAERFAERQGWEYYVQEPKEARIPPKSYGELLTMADERSACATFSPAEMCTRKLTYHSRELHPRPWQTPHSPHQVDSRTRRKCIISTIWTRSLYETWIGQDIPNI